MYKRFFKRIIDFTLASIGLICVSPILLIVTIWLHFANKGAGAFFLQQRPGRNGKIFKIVKFKTMTDERDASGELLSDNERLTRVGRFVRSTSIDELPQLINVVKGDMSLIGPRPLYTWFLPMYDEFQVRRLEVRPGITGWAQVNGRNLMSYSEKFKHDVWYVDHLSFLLDLKILYMTVVNVFKHEDIGNGLENEPDDLGWYRYEREAQEIVDRGLDKKIQWKGDVTDS